MFLPVPASEADAVAARAGWLDAVVAACLAPRCAVCGQWLATPTRGAVCHACWRAVAPFTPPLCATCGAPLAAGTRSSAPPPCALCRRAPLHHVDRAAALGFHDGTLREVVHALKFGRRHGIAARLARLLREAHGDLVAGADGVVPVPLHPRRHRQRGFNQAHEIARHLGPPVWPLLRRTRHTAPQSALDARARAGNVEGAFAVGRGGALTWRALAWRPWGGHGARQRVQGVEGRRVLLVDDVWTTGATLSACARALKDAGAREVRALVIARAVPSRLR